MSKAEGLLLNSSSLRELLGGGKNNRSHSQNASGKGKSVSGKGKSGILLGGDPAADKLIQSIILEETGERRRRKIPGKKKGKKSKSKVKGIAPDQKKLSGLERVRLARLARNTVVNFGHGQQGAQGEDLAYLDRHLRTVDKMVATNEQRIRDGYLQLLGLDSAESADTIVAPEDAQLLLDFGGVQLDEAAEEAIYERTVILPPTEEELQRRAADSSTT